MNWIGMVGLGAVGLWMIFAPRGWYFLGERWQFKDGDRAEPSDLYVTFTRGGGIVFLALAVVLGFAVFAADQERRASYAWQTDTVPPALRSVPVSDDVEALDSEFTLSQVLMGEYDPEQVPTLYAVVGSNDADPRMEIPGAVDGDLVLKIQDTLDCYVDRIVVQEDPDAVRVAIMYMESQLAAESFMGVEPESADDGCAATSTSEVHWRYEAYVVHVPLDEPLGDREVLDLDTGKPVLPVTDGTPEDDDA